MKITKTQLINRKLVFIAIVISLLLCISSCSPAYASSVSTGQNLVEPQPMRYIQVQITQWEELKRNNKLLLQKLNYLEVELSQLKNPSQELSVQLISLKKQLENSLAELTLTQSSLDNAKKLSEEMKSSINQLKIQINNEREKHIQIENRIKTQRNIAYTLLVGSLVYTLSK